MPTIELRKVTTPPISNRMEAARIMFFPLGLLSMDHTLFPARKFAEEIYTLSSFSISLYEKLSKKKEETHQICLDFHIKQENGKTFILLQKGHRRPQSGGQKRNRPCQKSFIEDSFLKARRFITWLHVGIDGNSVWPDAAVSLLSLFLL